jgi:hypothetical protein
MMDKVRLQFRLNKVDFERVMEEHFQDPDSYIFKGCDYFLLCTHKWKDDPEFPGAPDDFWLIWYAHIEPECSLRWLFTLTPYVLPYIAFIRGLRGKKDLKYYKTKRLHRLCNSLAQ